MNHIKDIEFKDLITHHDERGFFREIIRSSDSFFEEGFAQFSHSFLINGVIKAWHYHKIQTDFWYVASGVLRIGLCDLREESETYLRIMDFFMGDRQTARCLKIPPGIAHGCKVVHGPVNLMYVMDKIYNPQDEYRIKFDDPKIKFDWSKDFKI
jgi:dTDP-4-dehydrorhamnose 3,5-epimerase